MPDATLCIECAKKNDVSKIRRFDDHSGENVSETYFIHNPYIELAIRAIMKEPGPIPASMGDEPDASFILARTSGLASVIVDEDASELEEPIVGNRKAKHVGR